MLGNNFQLFVWIGLQVESGPTSTTPLPDKKLLVFILDRLQKYSSFFPFLFSFFSTAFLFFPLNFISLFFFM